MASPPSPPAVHLIGNLIHKMATSFKNDPVDISLRLLSKRLIPEDIQDRMQMNYIPIDKATYLVRAVKNTIEINPEMFEDLLQILSEHKDTMLVEKELHSSYQEIVEAQDSSSEDSCAQPMPKRLKLTESQGRIQNTLSGKSEICESAEIPHRKLSLEMSNPVIENTSKLRKDDEETFTGQLRVKVIQGEFLHLEKKILQSLKARNIKPKSLINTLGHCEVYTTEKQSQVNLYQLHIEDLSGAKDIYDVFLVISPYYSWFSYELIQTIICTHGSEKDKEEMEQYCQDFSENCRRIPCVEFRENDSISSCQTKITFKLDLDMESLNIYEIKCIQRNIAKILKLQSNVLVLSNTSIQDGCTALIFLVPSHIATQLVQLAREKKPTLSNEIKMITIDHDDHYQQENNGQDYQDLFESAKRGDLKRVQALIKGGLKIDSLDKRNCTALLHASHEGQIDVVSFLLEKGANNNWQADNGWTALILASYRGHVEVVELLLTHHSDVNLTTVHGWTALQRVCLYNQKRYPEAKYKPSEKRNEIAKLLIDHGTDIKKVDKQGRTPLIAASDSGFAEIVKLIVHRISEFPADERQKYLDHKKHYSWTALMSASEKGHTEVITILIEAGASRNITKDKDEVSALHIAVQNGHVEAVEVLTHKMIKEDINTRDNYGMTPLILATKKKSEQLINVLIHAGADVDAQANDEDQATALMFAVKVGSFDVVKLLVEKNANLFAINSRNETVLEMAKNSSEGIRGYILEKYREAVKKYAQKTTESY